MTTLYAPSVTALYPRLLHEILRHGVDTRPRGALTKEIRGVQLVIANPNDNVLVNAYRAPNYSFMVAEWLWILTGCALRDVIQPFNSNLDMAADRMGNEAMPTYAGAYGPKWVEQMPYILDALTEDPDSRQAVVNIWRDRPRKSADQPCTLSWQFFIRHGELEMHTHMRSNDAWLGVPYDLYNFTQIQRWVAMMLNVDVGPYHHYVGSMHLYERNFDQADLASRVNIEDRDDRFHCLLKAPSLGELSVTLQIAAMWRSNPAFKFQEAVIPAMAWLSEAGHDREIVLLPWLLMWSTPIGKKFFKENQEYLEKIAQHSQWADPIETFVLMNQDFLSS